MHKKLEKKIKNLPPLTISGDRYNLDNMGRNIKERESSRERARE
jgi:hypothetical protein